MKDDELERRLAGLRFEPRESLGPEIWGRVRRGERSLSDVRPRRRFLALGAGLAAALVAGAVFLADLYLAEDQQVVDSCCSNLDGGPHGDDGAVIYLRSDGSIRRLDIYEDRDGSRSFTPGDIIRLTRGSSPSLAESQTGPVTTTRHCCVDLDREGPPDDGLLVLSRPDETVVMAAIYETGGNRPLR